MHLEWIFIHFLPSLGFILALFLLVHLFRAQRSPSSTFAWLLAIILVPHFGVPLYILFGGRKMKKMAEGKEHYHRLKKEAPGVHADRQKTLPGGFDAVFQLEKGNHLTVLTSGEDAYRELITALQNARSCIEITTYILGNDQTGKAILEILTAKAARGIRVRLLLDALGSFRVPRRNIRKLKAAGGKAAFFMPMMPLPVRGRANLRNHRKIILVDQEIAFLGGMNLAHEYMGEGKDDGRWRDLSFRVEGPIIKDLYAVFCSDWKFAAKETLPPPEKEPSFFEDEEALSLQVMPSGPDVTGDPLHEAIVTSFFTAKKRIWIVTPYFIPDEIILRALCIAARRGIDVRIVVPNVSNHPLADLVRGSYLREVAQAGVKIFRFRPGMVHGKLIFVDEDFAITGSANMDMRSLFLNYEIALFIHDKRKIRELGEWISFLEEHSDAGVKQASQAKEVFEGMGRLLAPLL